MSNYSAPSYIKINDLFINFRNPLSTSQLVAFGEQIFRIAEQEQYLTAFKNNNNWVFNKIIQRFVDRNREVAYTATNGPNFMNVKTSAEIRSGIGPSVMYTYEGDTRTGRRTSTYTIKSSY